MDDHTQEGLQVAGNRTRESDERPEIDDLCVNTVRFLCVDAVQKADSGHAGMPLGAAPMACVLWMRHMKFNPANPAWFDRDRFVLSAGHGSMLLYALLHLTGYDLPLEEIKNFRQWESRTPGHPERNHTPGVEVSTGPLGQGFADAVGLALAEAHLGARFNRPGHEIIDHHTYVIASDGDLMEGVAAEATSLAGHLRLGKLVVLYDCNHTSLSASTDIAFTEDVGRRFEACRWHVQTVADGNDLQGIDQALERAREEKDRPSLIIVRTHLGYGSPGLVDSFEAHGKPLGPEEVLRTKRNLGWPEQPDFLIPEEALERFRLAVPRGEAQEEDWMSRFVLYRREFPDEAAELAAMIHHELPQDPEVPRFPANIGKMATRTASQTVLNAIAKVRPDLIGGDADLAPSTLTSLAGMGDLEPPDETHADRQGSAGGIWGYAGRNIHFGVREHAMGAMANGIAAHGALRPFVSTFLIFSDYMRPAIRLAALMRLPVIYVFTHDSIGLGEDGPTHQPVEQLAGLRAIPHLAVIRPADANETALAWQTALATRDHPVALVLTRQKVPAIQELFPPPVDDLRRGAYILRGHEEQPDLILIASGSEVHLALAAADRLEGEGTRTRVVSAPSLDLFDQQGEAYCDHVLPPRVEARIAIEAASPFGWHKYVGLRGGIIGVKDFGASAPGERVLAEYGFNVDNVVRCAHMVLERTGARRPPMEDKSR